MATLVHRPSTSDPSLARRCLKVARARQR
jgi:hypothetical protein